VAELEVIMQENYFDPRHPGSYSGVDKYYRSQVENTREDVAEFLRGEPAYTLHHPVRYRFARNKVVVSGMNYLWESDLCMFLDYADSNDGYKYILVATDVLSHKLYTQPLKSKTAREVCGAFERIFSSAGVKPQKMRTDRGGEFVNAIVKKYFLKMGVHHFTSLNEVKCAYAERVIKTLRMRLARYFTKKQTHRWVDVLADMTASYNGTFHRTIQMAPDSVTLDNESIAWRHQYESSPGPPPDGEFKIKVGDLVRISHMRRAFQKEYAERYTGELFKVTSRRVRGGRNMYSLADFSDEDVTGLFYEKEIQRVTADPDGVFHIERVIRSRKRKGKRREFLVSWRDYPAKFNSWVSEEDMTDV
jgi:hypothetical protein